MSAAVWQPPAAGHTRALKLDSINQGNMKHLFVVIAVLFAACAPEVPNVAETSGGETAGAGSVGADKEALLANCTNTSCICSKTYFDEMRNTMNLNYGCASGAWNPPGAFGSSSVQNTTCKYLGYKTTIRIDNCFGVDAGSAGFHSRFRISKTVGTDPRFNPWLVGTCYGAATCITQ